MTGHFPFFLSNILKKFLSINKGKLMIRNIFLIMMLVTSVTTRASTPETDKRQTYQDPTTGMIFAWVPKGCFNMGDDSDDVGDEEKPVHQVCLNKGYWLGKYEVIVKQFRQFTRATHYGGNGEDDYLCNGMANPTFSQEDNQPTVCITWDDANAFILWMNRHGHGTFRLATEAEWEYACRSGGKDEKYCGRNDVDPAEWYGAGYSGRTDTIGQKVPNGLGLYDMKGNVWEWVQNWKGSYPVGSVTDPVGPDSGEHRIYRGGGWFLYATSMQSAYRFIAPPYNRYSYIGFRVLKQP